MTIAFDAGDGFDGSPARPARLAESEPELVERFRELALTDLEHGYYTSPVARPTREGDFLTAPEMHPIFGATLARIVDETWRLLGEPADFTLREHGAGSGTLALAILEELRRTSPALGSLLRVEPIELNPHRRTECVERFAAAGLAEQLALAPGNPATGGLASRTPITGVIVANEYLDALPVHRVRVEGGLLREIFTCWRDGWFADLPGEPSTPKLAARLADEGVVLAEGQDAEICLVIDVWARAAARELERGIVLVIDYGRDAAELYGPSRRGGTLLAYAGHAVEEDPYRRVGKQDLTAHVDLTALTRAAEHGGLSTLGIRTQAELLVGAGRGELLEAARSDPTMTESAYLLLRSAVIRLLDPRATGAFRAVILGRDPAAGSELRALSFRLPSHGPPGTRVS